MGFIGCMHLQMYRVTSTPWNGRDDGRRGNGRIDGAGCLDSKPELQTRSFAMLDRVIALSNSETDVVELCQEGGDSSFLVGGFRIKLHVDAKGEQRMGLSPADE